MTDVATSTELQAPSTAATPPAPAGCFVPDHPGWVMITECRYLRLAAGSADAATVLAYPGMSRLPIHASPRGFHRLALPEAALAPLPPALSDRLASLSPLLRLPTPTVWEAVATAVVRQVVHRNQARASFHALARLCGTRAIIEGTVWHAFPTAEQLLSVDDAGLASTGIGFKRRTLRLLAERTMSGLSWSEADELAAALLEVPGVGRWTASIAVCDLTSDYGRYPTDDLAVRTFAKTRWPNDWPVEAASFSESWRRATHPFTAELTAFAIADLVLSDR